ncbi:hypothetical protein C7212DRAFT_348600 [Tuber magnatum]|uniref:RNase H type-1 domain-containing protein n=1 Tax=Tuber magnatum TaxID=42249 RepID=A0A317SEB3_9PEZI|nr:hypothetical protein C7212DRAFT_348600 [Tuber magnatum]
MEPYSRIFRPEILGFKNHTPCLNPGDVTCSCPSTGLSFTAWRDAYDNRFVDPTCIIIKIHGAFSLSLTPSPTPSSYSVSAPASASASFTSCSTTDWSQNTAIPSWTNTQSTYPTTLAPVDATTAYGLFFGLNSPRNSAGTVPHILYEQSKPHVDLFAAGMALMHLLQTVVNFSNPVNGGIRNVVLVTDSNYLFSCLTEHVYAWQKKGYRNAKGKEVSNANAVKWVESLVENFEGRGVGVRFWKVNKKDNGEAIDPARRVLEIHEEFRRRHGISPFLNIGAV